MGNSSDRIVIDPREVRRLYVDEGMTQREVAAVLGCSAGGVQRVIERHGIPSRRAIKRDQRGSKNTSWQGGRRVQGSYVVLCLPDHPLADPYGTGAEHVAVAYDKYGHAAPPGYVVHHVNMLKHDNRDDNLVYVPKRLHHLLHRQFEQVVPILLERGILSFDLEHGYYVTGTEPPALRWDQRRPCEQCGDEFLVRTKAPGQRFCTPACYRDSRRGRPRAEWARR